MTRNVFALIFALALFGVAVAACGQSEPSISTTDDGATAVDESAIPTEASGGEEAAAAAEEAAGEPKAEPVPMRQALSSFNTYRLQVRVVSNGPTVDDREETLTVYEGDRDADATHIRTENVRSTADDPEPDSSSSDTYQVGAVSCELSDGDAEREDISPLARDMNATMATLADMILTAENPVFVGQETVNGVAANRFTFQVTRLGKDSGGTVTRNAGDYWVARDGQYLVRYEVVLELTDNTQDPSQAQVYHSEIVVDLLSADRPLDIALPPACLE